MVVAPLRDAKSCQIDYLLHRTGASSVRELFAVEGQRHQIRRTVRCGTGHSDIFVVGESMLGVRDDAEGGSRGGRHSSVLKQP